MREGCRRRGVRVDVLGVGGEKVTADPARELRGADIVFAQGRSALEALAVGCAVVVATSRGLGPMITPDNLDELRTLNFGLRAADDDLTPDAVVARLDEYAPTDAAAISEIIRSDIDVARACRELLAVYARATDDHGPADPRLEAAALERYRLFLDGPRDLPTYDELSDRWLQVASRHDAGPGAPIVATT